MARKNKVIVRSNFLVAAAAGHQAVEDAVGKAVDAGQERANERLSKQSGQRGYNLDEAQVDKEHTGETGKIWSNPWWARFFEYGTVHISPLPFIRPGSRQMRKVMRDELGENFHKFVAAKAGMSKFGKLF